MFEALTEKPRTSLNTSQLPQEIVLFSILKMNWKFINGRKDEQVTAKGVASAMSVDYHAYEVTQL